MKITQLLILNWISNNRSSSILLRYSTFPFLIPHLTLWLSILQLLIILYGFINRSIYEWAKVNTILSCWRWLILRFLLRSKWSAVLIVVCANKTPFESILGLHLLIIYLTSVKWFKSNIRIKSNNPYAPSFGLYCTGLSKYSLKCGCILSFFVLYIIWKCESQPLFYFGLWNSSYKDRWWFFILPVSLKIFIGVLLLGLSKKFYKNK